MEKAITKAGNQSALAVLIGVSPQAVSNWMVRQNVPAEHCPNIEKATGVRCEELRPDVNWSVLRCKCPDTKEQEAA